jgi:hypothetical protein
MSLISIGRDPRSVIYKYLNNTDLYILRCTNIMFKREINPVSIKIDEIAELNEKNNVYNWFIKDSDIKCKIIKCYFDSDNFKLFTKYIHYLDPNTKNGINLIKYMINNSKYYYIEEFAEYNFSKYQLIIQTWKYEIIDYAYDIKNMDIFHLLRNIWIKRQQMCTDSFLIGAVTGLLFTLSAYISSNNR